MFRQAWQSMQRTVLRTAVSTTVILGTLEVTTHLPTQGRASEFYHTLSDQYVTPLMRRFLDPEVAHHVAIYCSQKGLAPIFRPSAAEQRVSVASRPFPNHPTWMVHNPLGLGAGYDKDGQVIGPMLRLGFGFVEIGTVTPQPQPGNPLPRMFRLPLDEGIINRYGFNSQGAAAVQAHLQAYRHGDGHHPASSSSVMATLQTIWHRLYPMSDPQGMVGVNIGKNKNSEDSVADYVSLIHSLGPYADYLVINVSSPNTENLRDWQKGEALERLLTACLEARDQLQQHLQAKSADPVTPVPLLIKLAPDLTQEEMTLIAQTCLRLGVDGLVVTNTTNQRPADLVSHHRLQGGGLSGAPVRDRSTECIRHLYAATEGELPIIGVGGVGSGHDAYEKLKAGASLVEVYSMMVYRGPGVVSRIRKELAELMLQNGQRTLEDVIGLDHDAIFWRKREERLSQQQALEKVLPTEGAASALKALREIP